MWVVSSMRGWAAGPRGGLTLAWRIVAVNAAVFAAGVAGLVLSPATVSARVSVREVVVLLSGLAALLLINLVLVRRSLDPLARLMKAMQDVDPLESDRALAPMGPPEVRELTAVFDEMRDRLQSERRRSGRRALEAQEQERKRVAQELHDEIGQSLTAVKLQLSRLGPRLPPVLQPDLDEAIAEVDRSLGDVRRIATRLRPEALDDLGLVPALTALTADFSSRTGLEIVRRIEPNLPAIGPQGELVVFRVAQEGLTNVARHADATTVELRLEQVDGSVRLVITDNGRGLPRKASGAGIEGMRERALLVGGRFALGSSRSGGVELRLRVPAGA
jgi:two-component system, NarL family, sensor histidine kinase UhpB